jgi:hypothetical protein
MHLAAFFDYRFGSALTNGILQQILWGALQRCTEYGEDALAILAKSVNSGVTALRAWKDHEKLQKR